jgi:hypothetical protein
MIAFIVLREFAIVMYGSALVRKPSGSSSANATLPGVAGERRIPNNASAEIVAATFLFFMALIRLAVFQ